MPLSDQWKKIGDLQLDDRLIVFFDLVSTSVHKFYQVSKKLFFCIISIRHTTPWLSEEPSAHAQTHIRQVAHCLYKVCRWSRGVVKRLRYRRFDFWSPFVRAPSLPSSMVKPRLYLIEWQRMWLHRYGEQREVHGNSHSHNSSHLFRLSLRWSSPPRKGAIMVLFQLNS